MPVLLVRLRDPAARARLDRAFAGGARDRCGFRMCYGDRWADLFAAAAEHPSAIAVVDPYAEDGTLEVEPLRGFRERFPMVETVAYAGFGARGVRDAIQLIRAGIAEIVVRGEEDGPAELRAVLEEVYRRSAGARATVGLASFAPPHLARFLAEILQRSHRPLTPRDLARLYHRHPNTLRQHLREAGLPPVNKLLVWLRLIHAATLLHEGESVERTACLLAFPSSAALRNQLRRYAAVTPGDLRERGGPAFLLACFAARQRHDDWDLHADHAAEVQTPSICAVA